MRTEKVSGRRERQAMGVKIKEDRRYRILVVLCAGAALAFIAVFYHFHPAFPFPLSCAVYEFTGLYCPGCGAGRACRALLQFQFVEAFCYNPVFVVLLPFIGLYFAVRMADWVITGGNHVDKKISARLLVAVLVLVLLYGVLRNIPAYPFTLLAPGGLAEILL